MPLYPLCLDIAGRLCVVIGGGAVAARKVGGLLDCAARVRVVSPHLCPQLLALASAQRIESQCRCYMRGDLAGAWLVFAATNVAAVQQAVAAEAEAAAIPCNLAEAPDQGSFHVPAVLRRGNLTIAVATGGRSPALAAMLKHQLAQQYGAEYAVLVELFGDLRERVLARRQQGASGEGQDLRSWWHPQLAEWVRQGQTDRLNAHFRALLGFDPGLDLADCRAKGEGAA